MAKAPPIDPSATAAERQARLQELRSLSPGHYDRTTDSFVGPSNTPEATVSCSFLRDPALHDELNKAIADLPDDEMPLPDPDNTVNISSLHGLVDDRIAMRNEASNVITAARKGCGPKPE